MKTFIIKGILYLILCGLFGYTSDNIGLTLIGTAIMWFAIFRT